MKKLVFILTLISSLFTSTSFSSEEKFHYETKIHTKFATAMVAGGALMFATGTSVEGAGKDIPGAGLILLAAGGSYFGFLASFSGFKDIKAINFSNTFKRYKALSKASLATGVATANKQYQKLVIDNFDCSWCTTDEEKVRKFAKVFIEIDSLAYEVVKKKIFSERYAEDIFSEYIVDKKISQVLEEDDNSKNRDFINNILALSITYHFMKQK